MDVRIMVRKSNAQLPFYVQKLWPAGWRVEKRFRTRKEAEEFANKIRR